jgi:thioredoxin-related protein
MRVPNRFIFSIIFILFIASTISGNEIKFREVTNQEEWDAAFALAKIEKKLVFVDIYTDWCTYCHKLDKEVYTDDGLAEYFNENFINVKFDAETEFGYPLTIKYDVTGYPKLLFLTKKQRVYESIDGFVPTEVLMEYGSAAHDSWKSLPLLLTKQETNDLSRDEQLELIGILEKTDQEKAEVLAEKYIKGLKEADYEDIEILWLVSRFQNQLTSASFKYISKNKYVIVNMHGKAEYDDYMKSVYNDNLNLSIKYNDTDLLQRLITEILPEFLDKSEVGEAAFITKKLFYRERQQYDEYKFEVNTFVNNQVSRKDKPEALFQNAMEIIETINKTSMYIFASDLLTESIEMNEDYFEATALLGYANGVLKNYKEADEILIKAKSLAADDDEKEMVDNIIQAIKQMKIN